MKKYPKIPHKTRKDVNFVPFEPEHDVVIQEKVDGENFRIQIEKEEITDMSSMFKFSYGSRRVDNINANGGFGKIIEYFESEPFMPTHISNLFDIATRVYRTYVQKITVFGEFLGSHKHKKIPYDRAPKNNLAVFDIMISNDKEYAFIHPASNLFTLICDTLKVDKVPILYMGKSGCGMQDFIKLNESFFDKMSYLGGHKIEGTVAKNYENFIDDEKGVKMVDISFGGDELGLPMIKFVQEHLKEHAHVENIVTDTIEGIVNFIADRCITEGRVYKALTKIEFDEQKKCDRTDTPKIIKEVMNDVLIEEDEHIRKMLYKEFKDKFGRKANKIVKIYFKLLEKGLEER